MKFKTLKANEYCDSVRDGTHDSPKKVEKGYKLITSKNIKEYGLDLQNASNISKKDYDKVNERSLVEKNDILYSMIGTIGLIHRVNYEPNYAIKNIGLFKIKDEQKSKWLYYYLKTPKMKNYINSLLAGSTQQYITLNNLRELPIQIPEITSETNKIIYILDLIETKIMNNTHTNNNLYKLSKTIFRDFYNSNSEKWNICKINDIGLYISDYVANGSFKSLAQNVKIYDNKNYALFIRNTDLKVNFTQGRKYVDEHSYNFLSKSKLYGRELIISNVGDVGSIFLCPSFEIPMTLGNNVIMIDSKETKVNYNYYLYYFFLSAEGQYLIDGITGGSAQPKFNKTDFKNSLIKLPSKEDILEFNDKIIPMYDIIEKNIKENDILEQLRDTLLPKLMNGEIDLDKVEI